MQAESVLDVPKVVRDWVVACLCVCSMLGAARAAQPTPLPEVLTNTIQILEDRDAHLPWDAVVSGAHDADFRSVENSSADMVNLGYSASAFWLRIPLHNTMDTSQEKLLELGYNRISMVDFYVDDGKGGWTGIHTGNLRPFDTRVLANRHFVWPLELPPRGVRTVYIRLESTSPIFIPLRLWSPTAFHAHERTAYAHQALYYGMALAMVVFNLLLFLALRDKAYIYYVGFVASMALSIAVRTGLAKEFLPLDASWWWETSSFLSNSVACAAFLIFMRQMLQSQTQLPGVDRWIQRVLVAHLLLPLLYVPYYRALAIPMIWVYIATLVFILGSGMYGAWKRLRAAYFFVAAFVLLFMSALMNSLTSLGYLPANIITNNLLQFGSACEMVLLAFALADRINSLRQEKLLAQGQILAAQNELVLALQDSERALEARVQERTNELQVLNQKLEALSTTDGLTGIANRRSFDETLLLEWRRALRAGSAISVGLIDVDWFKPYNDGYGHQKGDECLRQVAHAIEETLGRSHDFVARYGGEEFVFIAPVSAIAEARAVGEKICQSVRALQIPHCASEFGQVTVSVGVAFVIPDENSTAEALVQAADHALYRSKANGRNRVT